MSTKPAPLPGAGIDAQIAQARATPVAYRNNVLLCLATMLMGVVTAFLGVCLAIIGLTVIFPLNHMTVSRALGGLMWILGAVWVGGQCPWLWALGRGMMHYQVVLNQQGVSFRLGTKAQPSEVFLPWEQVVAIRYRRAGNNKEFRVLANDGGGAVWSYYTFFRPKKVARLIAERTGLPIEKA